MGKIPDKIENEADYPEEFKRYFDLLSVKTDANLPDFSADWLNRKPVYSVDPSSVIGRRSGKIWTAGLSIAATILLSISGILYYLSSNKSGESPTAGNRAIAVSLSGEVTVRSDRGEKKLFAGDMVLTGDLIETNADGKVDLAFSDGAMVRINPGSRLKIEELKSDDKSNFTVSLYLQKGESTSLVRRITARDSYRVVTPTAIAGVRGTSFSIETDGQNTRIVLMEGRVEASAGSAQSVILEEKDTVSIPAGASSLEVTRDEAAAAEKTADLQEMNTNLNGVSSRIFEAAGEIRQVHSEKELSEIYHKEIEIIILKNGRIFRGVVASQVDGQLLILTVDGTYMVSSSDVAEVVLNSEETAQ